jgi:alkylation response protein AidB-like acyl-CoA dehydrogenase
MCERSSAQLRNFFSSGTSANIFFKLVFAEECAHCASGGMGHMQSTKSERSYRKVKVMMIGGGSKEILKDFAARHFGI